MKNFRLPIREKMQILILSISFLIYVFSIGYISIKLKKISYKKSIELADSYAKENASLIESSLNIDMYISRTLAQSWQNFRDISMVERTKIYHTTLRNILRNNQEYYATWSIWDLQDWDPNWKKEYGRTRFLNYRDGEIIKQSSEIVDTTQQVYTGLYYDAKEHKSEFVTDPYFFEYKSGEIVLETSVFSPILENGQFAGIVGIDIKLDRFQNLIESIKPFEDSYAMLIANNGTIVAHPDKELIGLNIKDEQEKINEKHNISEKIKSGKNFSIDTESDILGNIYISYRPINIGRSIKPWAIAIVVPIKEITKEAHNTFKNSIIVGVIGLLILFAAIYFISHRLTMPLNSSISILRKLSNGDIDPKNKLNINSNDEIGDMAKNLNTLIDGLNNIASFAKEIGKGNLIANFSPLSPKDILGYSLIEMRESLQKAKTIQDEREKEQIIRHWETNGIAKFDDILRKDSSNIYNFAYNIVSELVKYSESIQGGIFILNDDNNDNRYFEMLACYAYNRRKYKEKTIPEGIGLIGRCALESKVIHLTEIPDDYLEVTSGLGQNTPESLLLVPLKINEEIYGIIELASLKAFESHIISFIEKISENIASTLSTIKINRRTKKLLEESKIQAEELAAQDEEMRQNMEELQATQEEASRKTVEMEGLIKALNSSAYVIEYDLEGKIIDVNNAFVQLTQIPSEQLIGTHHSKNIKMDGMQEKKYREFWDDLKNGQTKKQISKITINEKEYTLAETYSPIKNISGDIIKIIKIASDITSYNKK